MIDAFNNPRAYVQSWYIAPLGRRIRPGEAVSVEMFGRRIAFYRTPDSQLHALDAHCAHFGADLGLGKVIGNDLRCSFHHWRYGAHGKCVSIPTQEDLPEWASVASYPVQEKYGVVWIFNGPQPLFQIPSFEQEDGDLRLTHFPQQLLKCHPHAVTSNGLDLHHFKTVHDLEFYEPPGFQVLDSHRIQARLPIRLDGKSPFVRCLRFLAGPRLEALFTTCGGNMATIAAGSPGVRFYVLFAFLPLPSGHSLSRTFVFIPKTRSPMSFLSDRFRMAMTNLTVVLLLWNDKRLFNTIRFSPRFVDADAPLKAFRNQVRAMPCFPEGVGANGSRVLDPSRVGGQ